MEYAIIDSGSRMIFMAYSDYQTFTGKLTSANSKLDCTSQKYCYSDSDSCTKLAKKFDDLVFYIDGIAYSVPASSYLYDGFNGHKCGVAVTYTGILDNKYVLGDAFIRNYFVTFNYAS